MRRRHPGRSAAAPVDGHEPRFRGRRRGRRHHGARRHRDFRQTNHSNVSLSAAPAALRRKAKDTIMERQTPPSSTSAADAGSSPAERVMRIAPLDLRQQRFRTALRGFDRTEVVGVPDRGRRRLRARAAGDRSAAPGSGAGVEALLAEHRDRETNLRNTLLTAQRLADEIKEAAQNEAQADRPRGAGTRRPAAAEGAGPARRGRARHQRDAAAPARRRGLARGVDSGALPRARVHPRAGSLRTTRSCSTGRARPDSAGTATPRRESRRPRAADDRG